MLLRIVLAVALITAWWPVMAQEQRPYIRVAPREQGPTPVIPVRSYGPGFPEADPTALTAPGEWNDALRHSLGCFIAGTAGTVVALVAGGTNVVNVIAGGLVVPANAAVLYTGLVGVVFASFCAVGQALTPLYLYYFGAPSDAAMDTAPRVGRSGFVQPATVR